MIGVVWCVRVLIGALGFIVVVSNAAAEDKSPSGIVRTLLEGVNDSTDLARIKLTLDKIVDPSIDVTRRLAEIDELATTVLSARPRPRTSLQKLDALRQLIYVAGAWNQNKPFQYDLSDPEGQNLRTRLLSTYLDTRRGNCISMPFLFLAVAERVGLKVTAALAPLHVFIKHTDDSGQTHNLEPTSGAGFTRDVWYRRQLPMTDKAIANGLYMRALSKRETAATMAMVVVEHLMQRGDYFEAIATTDEVLRVFPQSVYAMVKRGSAYGHLMRVHYIQKYSNFRMIPATEQGRLKAWHAENHRAFKRAEALGWQPSKL